MTELEEKFKQIDVEYHEALKAFREIESKRNSLMNEIAVPKYRENIGKCYRKANAGSDSDDDLAHYQFFKITDVVYEPESWFYQTPQYKGIIFGMGTKGSMFIHPNEYITINSKFEEIPSDDFNKQYTRLVNKLIENESYAKKS